MEKETLNLAIEGMHCGGCVRRVTVALEKLEGVEVVRVEVGSAEIRRPAGQPEAPVLEAIGRLGFKAARV